MAYHGSDGYRVAKREEAVEPINKGHIDWLQGRILWQMRDVTAESPEIYFSDANRGIFFLFS